MQEIPPKDGVSGNKYIEIFQRPAAKLVVNGNYDLTIEVANHIGSDVFYRVLSEEGYNGSYLALNPSHAQQIRNFEGEVKRIPSLETVIEDKNSHINRLWNSLRGKKSYGCLDTGMFYGDALSDKDVTGIIELVKPENPIYVANDAIGIILSYYPNHWMDFVHMHTSGSKNVLSKMSDVWAQNLSKTSLKSAILSDYVFDSEHPEVISVRTEEGHEYLANYDGVSQALYSNLLNNFENNGWKTHEISIAKSKNSEFRMVKLSR